MGSDSLIAQLIDFIVELVNSFSSGYVFFGSTLDVIRYAIDITMVAALFYWILLFVKQSRAWQLIKGIVLILLFVLMCGLFGLEMVGFIFNRLLYVIAILFIVLFQPELRRVLETVGLKSFTSVKSLFVSDDYDNTTLSTTFVHEICNACSEMASSYTGALILIERKTRLDELLTQENVVRFDSTVTSSVLQSIFYKGSPMHDGGLLIRDGRIIAARCHVPLSVTMHNLQRSGTRHRAAVGASEMGDTVVVVVSEERGKTSIAVNGNLYEMKDVRELEANLDYLLGVYSDKSEKRGLGRIFHSVRRKKKAEEEARLAYVTATEAAGEKSENLEIRTAKAEVLANSSRVGAGTKLGLMLLSLLMSFCLWMYIQVNTNPVVTTSITVPITYNNSSTPDNIDVSYPVDSVDLELVGRQETLDRINASDIIATIDYSAVSDTGVVELPVVVTSSDSRVYFRVERQVPETISVTVYSLNDTASTATEG
ncbi:MAG: diadenylate cyclase [Clostridiales bacterium]|nr:diadenylate cyclase [Clostridiales bacterium]